MLQKNEPYFKPVCAVVASEDCPGAEFEDAAEAAEYCRQLESERGRNGEFPTIVFYNARD